VRKILVAFLLAAGLAAATDPSPSVRFAVIGDRTGGHMPGIYEQVVAEVERLRPDFVLTVGDHIEGYTEDTAKLGEEWRKYRSIVSGLAAPLHLAPGNHDITSDAALPAFEQYAGNPYYSFNVSDLHFIVLDNSRWESSDKLPAEQLDWLAADLGTTRGTRFTFVFMHKPFWDGTVTEGKPDTLHKLFLKYGVDAVFAGHYHQYFSGEYDGIRYTVLGSSGGETEPGPTGVQYHFTWVTVDDAGIHVAPVKTGSVLPWDEVTVADMQAIGRNELAGLSFEQPVEVTETMKAKSMVRAVVANPPGNPALDDTLRWEVPDGWTVKPGSVAVSVPAGEKRTYEFECRAAGNVFPLPTAMLAFPYAPGKTSMVKRQLHVARTARSHRGAPMVDGVLNEKAWQDPVLRFFGADGGPAKADSSWFYFAHDDNNLYVGVRALDRMPDSIRARATGQDEAVYNDDCAGFFFAPTAKEVFQVYFNPLGAVFDQKITISDKGEMSADPAWNGSYEVKATRDDKGWSLEARIPFAEFGPALPTEWAVNFRRKQPRLGNADWQVPISYDPGTYGKLVLLK